MEQLLQIPVEESKKRITRIQQQLVELGIDAALISDNANKFYITGRVYNGYCYIPSQGEAIFFVRRPVELIGDNLVYIHKPEIIVDALLQKGNAHISAFSLFISFHSSGIFDSALAFAS